MIDPAPAVVSGFRRCPNCNKLHTVAIEFVIRCSCGTSFNVATEPPAAMPGQYTASTMDTGPTTYTCNCFKSGCQSAGRCLARNPVPEPSPAFVPRQGWECPRCHRINAPSMPNCTCQPTPIEWTC